MKVESRKHRKHRFWVKLKIQSIVANFIINTYVIVIHVMCDGVHNILRLFDVLSTFPFPASKTGRDY